MRAEVEICIRESWEHRLSPFCAGSLGRARSATERGPTGRRGALERWVRTKGRGAHDFAKRTPAALRRGGDQATGGGRADGGQAGCGLQQAQGGRSALLARLT